MEGTFDDSEIKKRMDDNHTINDKDYIRYILVYKVNYSQLVLLQNYFYKSRQAAIEGSYKIHGITHKKIISIDLEELNY